MDIQAVSDELIRFGKEQVMQDLYIYPTQEGANLSFRKHQETTIYQTCTIQEANQLITRLKYLGEMDVGETRKAQVGAITYPLDQETQRLRLSSVGDYQGRESMVIRFLHERTRNQVQFFFPEDASFIVEKIRTHTGLYLFSGPTGSGKTTFMYEIARTFRGQVIAIEDPVEIEEPAFLQLQTNTKIDQTYDQLIKLSLRHRPDLLLIGEVRDAVTAKAALRAALTGHTVFATVHARGIEGTRSRFMELIGENSELDQCLNGVIYQRLLLSQSKEVKSLIAYKFFTGEKEERAWSESYAQLETIESAKK